MFYPLVGKERGQFFRAQIVDSNPLYVFLDTGADINLIHVDVLDSLPAGTCNWLNVPIPKVTGIVGPTVQIKGCVSFYLNVGNFKLNIQAYVAKDIIFPAHILLGYPTMKEEQIYVVPHEQCLVCKGSIFPLVATVSSTSDSANACRSSNSPTSVDSSTSQEEDKPSSLTYMTDNQSSTCTSRTFAKLS